MVQRRIDEFWFEIFDDILDMTHTLSNNRPELVSAKDWLALSVLSQLRLVEAVRYLLFPGTAGGRGSDPAVDAQALCTRSTVFLTALEDHEYHCAYEEVLKMESKELVNIQSLLKNSKNEGRGQNVLARDSIRN
ncbi:hypothetical protein VE03_07122 [Pseudogymnoascus sp. 23342-1-I1]|nr:hypothetical protein VE03_07122 [Pseudogymnoascus sp. 23342-1-I1]